MRSSTFWPSKYTHRFVCSYNLHVFANMNIFLVIVHYLLYQYIYTQRKNLCIYIICFTCHLRINLSLSLFPPLLELKEYRIAKQYISVQNKLNMYIINSALMGRRLLNNHHVLYVLQIRSTDRIILTYQRNAYMYVQI